MRDEFHGGPWDGQSQVHISDPINTPYRREPSKDKPGVIAWIHDVSPQASLNSFTINPENILQQKINNKTTSANTENIKIVPSHGKTLTLQDLDKFVKLAKTKNMPNNSKISASLNFSGHLRWLEIKENISLP